VAEGEFDADERYRTLLDHSSEAVCAHQGGRLVYVNKTAVRWLGAELADQIVGQPFTTFLAAECIPAELARISVLQHQGDASEPSELVIRRPDGSGFDVEAVTVLTMWNGEPAYQTNFRDLPAQRITGRLFESVVSSLDDAVVVLDHAGRVVSTNPAMQRLLDGPVDGDGIPRGADWSRRCDDGCDRVVYGKGPDMSWSENTVLRTLRDGTPYSGELFSVSCSAGSTRWLAVSSRRLSPEDGSRSAVLITLRDVTAVRSATERFAHQAMHDPLTGLPNRTHLVERLSGLRAAGALTAVLFIDLDDLKAVNDTFGHDVGDAVILNAAQRLRAAVRNEDLVCRYAGDEFVVLLVGAITADGLAALADRIDKMLTEPVSIGDRVVRLGASIGTVVTTTDDSRDAGTLLGLADRAMYSAKAAGRRAAVLSDSRKQAG
jgi:diguanylate cyclase (GGDEF)-like protein/PAS domain S-box-containing protein